MQPFHLAIAVADLATTRAFYVEVLGCRVGRSSPHWIDFDLLGHQITAHLRPESVPPSGPENESCVDEQPVPIPHFGVVLEWNAWQDLSKRLQKSGMNFIIPPMIRFEGQTGEQASMFFRDPSGNALEFKSFRDPSQLFAP